MTTLDFTIIGRDLSGQTFEKLTLSLDKLIVKADVLDKQKVNVKVDVNSEGALSKLTLTSETAEKLDKKNVNVRVGVDDAVAIGKLEATSKVAEGLDHKKVDVRIDVNNAGAIAKIAETEAAVKGVDASAARAGSASGGMSLFGRAFTTFGAAAGIHGSAKLGEVRNAISETDSKAKAATGAGSGLGALSGGFVALGVVAGIASGVAVHLALSFDETVHKMAASAQIPVEAAKQIGSAFLTTGGQTTFSAQQMLDAFGPVALKLGELQGHALDSAQSLEFMRAAMDATEATGGDLSATTDALSKVMVAFGIGTDGAAHAADILTNASQLTNNPIASLADGMDKLHAKLGTAAPDLAGMSTLLVDLGNHGITGTKGLNQVNAGITQLLGGSKAAKDEIATLGLKVTDSSGHFVGFGSIIEQLQPKLAHMTDEQKRHAEAALFGSGAQGSMNAIIAEGKGKFDELTDSVGKAGSAQEAAAKATDDAKGRWEKIKAALENTGAAIGTALLPAIEKIVGFLQPIIQKVTEWTSAHPKLTAALLIAAVAVGVLAIALIAIGAVVSAITAPFVGIVLLVVGIIAGLVAAALAVWKFHKEIFDALTAVWGFFVSIFNKIKDFLSPFIEFFKGVFSKVGEAISGAFSSVGDAIAAPFNAAIEFVKNNIVAPFMNWWNSHWEELKDVFVTVFDAIKVYFQAFWTGLKVILDVVIGIFRIAFDVIKGVVTVAIDVIVAIVKVGFAILTLVFKVIWDAIVAVFKIAWSIISNVVQIGIAILVAVVKTVWAGIVAVFKIVWDIVVGIFSFFLDIITGHWSKAWADIKNLGIQIWNAIKGFFGSFLDNISNMFKTIGEKLINIAKDIWNAVSGFFANLWHDVVNFVMSLWHDVVNLWTQIRNAVVNTVISLWHDVVNFFVNLWHDLVNNVTTLWHDIEALWHQIFDGVINWVVRIWHDVVGFFHNLWNDIVGVIVGIWNSVGEWFGNIWRNITDFAGRIWHDTVHLFNNLKDDITQVFKDMANNGFVIPINWVIDNVMNSGIIKAINAVTGLVGIPAIPNIPDIPRFQSGGIVPGGYGGGDSYPALLEPGETVVPKHLTSKVAPILSAHGVPGFENIGAKKDTGGKAHLDGGIIGWIGDIAGDVGSAISSTVSSALDGLKNLALGGLRAGVSTVFDHVIKPLLSKIPGADKPGTFSADMVEMVTHWEQQILDWLGAKDSSAQSQGGGPVGAGVQQWAGLVNQALGMVGQPGSELNDTLRRMQQESGGNPNAINLNDVNAQRGTPSIGLMQVIEPTFAAYRDSRAPNNIYDPLANILASMHYALARYGSLAAAYNRAGGYAAGGLVNGGGTGTSDSILAKVSNGEFVVNADSTSKNLSVLSAINGGGTISGAASGGSATGNAGGKSNDLSAAMQKLTQKVDATTVAHTLTSNLAKNSLLPSLQAIAATASTSLTPSLSNLVIHANSAAASLNGGLAGHADSASASLIGTTGASTQLQRAIEDGVLPNVIKLGEVSTQVWTALLTQGWKGNPNDKQEAIYKPSGGSAIPSRGPVVLGSVPQATWDRLLSQGWRGHPGDKMEALYPPGFAIGGVVNGPGSGTSDDIHAKLSNGEFVMTADATAKYRSLLEAMNAKRFADGGIVGQQLSGTTASVSSATAKSPLDPTTSNASNAATTKLNQSMVALGISSDKLGRSSADLKIKLTEQATGITAVMLPSLRLAAAEVATKMPQANDKLVLSNQALRNDESLTSLHAFIQWQATQFNTNNSVVAQNHSMDDLRNGMGVTRQHMTDTQTWAGLQWRTTQQHVDISVAGQNRAMDALRFGLGVTRQSFTETANWAGVQFNRTYQAAANPIRDTINRPIRGLVDAWNSLDGQFAFGRHVVAPGAPFAAGGFVSGPGGPTEDLIPALLSNGEFVVRAGITNRVRGFLTALNSGQAEAMQAAQGKGYATGGLVTGDGDRIPTRLSHGEFRINEKVAGQANDFLFALNAGSAKAIRAAGNGGSYASGGIVADTGSAADAKILKAQLWAKAQSGKPYIWGSAGPAGYDCSGFMSAITNVLRDQNPYRRLWSTASFARGAIDGFTPGLTSGFAIGVMQGNPGHMAGTLGGVNVESGGPHNNVAFGAPAVGADAGEFPAKFSLPFVGGKFVSGGSGAGIDIGAIVNGAFAAVPGMFDEILHSYSGNIAAAASVGAGHLAEQKIRDLATSKLNDVVGSVGGGDVKAIVQGVMAKYGWGAGPEWDAVDFIVSHESGWNPNAHNPNSSAAGLFQKMTSVNGPLEPTVAGQAEWGANYMRGRYGDPIGARSFWQAHHYYANGGFIDSPTLATLGEAGKELVLPLTRPQRTENLLTQAGLRDRGSNRSEPQKIEIVFKGNTDTAHATAFMKLLRDGDIQIKQSQIARG